MSKRKSKKHRQIREVRMHSEDLRALQREKEELHYLNQVAMFYIGIMNDELHRVYSGVQQK